MRRGAPLTLYSRADYRDDAQVNFGVPAIPLEASSSYLPKSVLECLQYARAPQVQNNISGVNDEKAYLHHV